MSIHSSALSDHKKKHGTRGDDGPCGPPWRILDEKWDGHSTFTVDECAEILRISRCSAYAAVKNKEIPAVWIGRRAIVSRGALEKLLSAV